MNYFLNNHNTNKNIFFICVIILHLAFIDNYPISVESSFINLAKYFENFDKPILFEYIGIQANNLTFSYLIYVLNNFLFIDNFHYSGKILSIISYFFIFYAIKNFNKYFSITNNKLIFFITALILTNPIIWIYGFKATPDLLPTSIGFFAVSILLHQKKKYKKIILSSLFLSLTILLKPMFAILILFCVGFIFFTTKFENNMNKTFQIIIFLFISLFPICLYIYSIKQLDIPNGSYGTLSIYLQNISDFNILNFLTSFLYQVGLLGLFTLPIILCSVVEIFKKKINFFIIVIFFILGYVNSYFPGELDLGTFFTFNVNFLKGSYFALAVLLILTSYFSYFETNYKNKKIYILFLFTILAYISILSLFRPAQRYLMLIIPFYYYFYFAIKQKIYYKITIFIIPFFFLINLILTGYSYSKSSLAEEVIQYLHENDIKHLTTPGPVADSYNSIKYDKFNKKYSVIKKNNVHNYIKKFTSSFLFIEINYYLVVNK